MLHTDSIAMPRAGITLKQLHKMATEAGKHFTKEFGQTVVCKYVGQRYGPMSKPKYRSDPGTWVVEEDEWRSQTIITFAFQRGGANAEWTHREVACKNAVSKGVPAPEAWLQPEVTLAELHKLAAAAGKRLSKEFGQDVLCKYRGQRCVGPRSSSDPEYQSDPDAWVVGDSERRSHTVITFAFQRGGDDADWATREVYCNHAFARGVLAPQEWYPLDVGQLRSAAAASAMREHSYHSCKVPITCEYIGQKQVLPSHAIWYEPDPNKWQVPAGERTSQMQVTFLWSLHTDVCRQDRVEVAANHASARQSVPFPEDIEVWTNEP